MAEFIEDPPGSGLFIIPEGAVEDPPGSGLFTIPDGFVEDPPGSGLLYAPNPPAPTQPPREFPSIYPSLRPASRWRFEILDPITLERWALEGWQSATVTENFEGVEITINMPGHREELNFLIELVTDVLVYDDSQNDDGGDGEPLTWRCRVMNVDDAFTTETHDVTITCRSYEKLFARRVLFNDFDALMEQHEIAWWFINYTQAFQTLGVAKAADWASSGVDQDRIIQAGRSIEDSINEAASAGVGFDWWIDEHLKLHAQTPRRSYPLPVDLLWGANVVTLQRSSGSAEYNSVVQVFGSRSESILPSGTYPAPPPVVRQLTLRPIGRWEAVFSYPDIVTASSVVAKAEWHLSESVANRRTYTAGLQYGIWDKSIRPGAVMQLRIDARPRINSKVMVRVEELQIAIGASGEEDVTLGLRGETAETDLGSGGYAFGQPPQLSSPPTASDIAPTAPTGLSRTKARISNVARLVEQLVDLRARIRRSETNS